MPVLLQEETGARMNCKHVQELLPLCAGRDLDEKRAELVSAHVQSCAECAAVANEYRQSAQLLQLFAPPAFSEGVYNGIRQRVLREIERESPKSIVPALPQLVAGLFGPRIRWALATALLVAVSAGAFYFITSEKNKQQLAGPGAVDQANRGRQVTAAPSPSSTPNNGPPLPSTGKHRGAEPTLAVTGERPTQTPRRNSPGSSANAATSVSGNADSRTMNARVSPELKNLAQPGTIPSRGQTIPEKTLRVEMQTQDPNIRIIWFSPQRHKNDSPGKSSKRIQEVRSYA